MRPEFGGINAGKRLPASLRRKPFVELIAGVVAASTGAPVAEVLRTASAGLALLAAGPWLALHFLERLPGVPVRPVPVAFGRFRYRLGLFTKRAAEEFPPLRRLETFVREAVLGRAA